MVRKRLFDFTCDMDAAGFTAASSGGTADAAVDADSMACARAESVVVREA